MIIVIYILVATCIVMSVAVWQASGDEERYRQALRTSEKNHVEDRIKWFEERDRLRGSLIAERKANNENCYHVVFIVLSDSSIAHDVTTTPNMQVVYLN